MVPSAPDTLLEKKQTFVAQLQELWGCICGFLAHPPLHLHLQHQELLHVLPISRFLHGHHRGGESAAIGEAILPHSGLLPGLFPPVPALESARQLHCVPLLLPFASDDSFHFKWSDSRHPLRSRLSVLDSDFRHSGPGELLPVLGPLLQRP